MMASVVAGDNRKKSLTLRGVDPETCMIVFKNHWAQVVKILEKHEASRSSSGALSFLSAGSTGALRLGPIPPDEASAVQNYVEHMLFLLMEEEAGQGGAMGPILEFVVVEGVMERLFLWSLRRQFTEDMKLEQLRMYQMLLSQARQPLLHHKPVLRPLMTLLASCAGAAADGGLVETELVLLLNQLCDALVRDSSVLELFFHTSQDQGAANFLLFSLLIPYTHRQGVVGQQARDALLLIMSLSASEPRVAQHIAENTYFCPVLATGLSGLYSSLPAKLQVYSEDWHCLEQADWQQVPALVHFLHSLDFCGTVIKVAHPSIRSQLLDYIYNGFLVPVLAPALHKLTVEEVMTTTAYLDLFLRSVSEPALLHTFLSFILLHNHDNVHILDTLVSRINTPFQLGTVSLALFRTLIGLFCEDVMLQLVFRYLIPCTHLNVKERASLMQRDCYSSSASSFLLLTPSWCPLHPPYTPPTPAHTEHIHWPKGAEADSVGYCRGSDFLMDVNYTHYLCDARIAISISYSACRLWSAPYDGINPSPWEHHSQTPSNRMEDEVGGDGECEQAPVRVKRDSSPAALSPTPSSSCDTVSMGNQAGRAGSTLELEWDDMFTEEDDDRPQTPPAPPVPPRHIQDLRRSAISLVRGAYVEESDFQDDVLVYDLVAQRDAKAAMLDRVVLSRRMGVRVWNGSMAGRAGSSKVSETVNSIMSARRRSEDGGGGDRRRSDSLTNGFSIHNAVGEKDDDDDDSERKGTLNVDQKPIRQKCSLTDTVMTTKHHHTQNKQCSETNSLPNGHSDHQSCDLLVSLTTKATGGDDFLSQYRELMLSLGAEPDCYDITDDIGTFRKRVGALRERQEEEGLMEEVDLKCAWEEREEEEEGEGEEERDGRHGISFTGPFISVLLSRLENLLENSIAVNLLVTGILTQLASYPQPLLRSFLLNTHTHCRPNARTLYQVLVSVRAQIERYMSDRPDYAALVTQAWRFLLAKDQDNKVKESLQSSQGGDIMAAEGALAGALPPCPPVPPQARSRVFGIVLYAEFLKELAALAQEHSIAHDGSEESHGDGGHVMRRSPVQFSSGPN
ncbi:LOW QUALITY PROTEIN: FHF complex subunit HOOK-interacting protein 1A-like [Lampris incognitus]|uniref:LOW QUALITY PROTEIN: FHF complex subunit HOOK-interacting protein 1A-like n=1 Tax=Lampris incognitus TaxID=2546036 RepID=UPI0024B59C8A|nr:LOW QUALITY PROTEIN: FHF complex subunit HOOK-interacting protein 1A-like [Lampris incognitus]